MRSALATWIFTIGCIAFMIGVGLTIATTVTTFSTTGEIIAHDLLLGGVAAVLAGSGLTWINER